MYEDELPKYSAVDQYATFRRSRRRHRRIKGLGALAFLACLFYYTAYCVPQPIKEPENILLSADRLQSDYATCAKLRSTPRDPSGPRERNGRYLDGHKAILISNATVWTGEPAGGTSLEDAHVGRGYSWITADVFLEHGLIKRVEAGIDRSDLSGDYDIYEAHGRMLTSGIVDMHSHTGVDTLPELRGWSDDNELSSDITPYVRSIDGFSKSL